MRRDKPEESTAFNPPVHRRDEGRHINVSIGLPGVTEEQIRIDLEKTTVTVSITIDRKTLKKAIRVPAGARVFKKKFSDGTLEIVLEKPVA
ncbi:MAG: Hsp20/alpha crystallin family protein [Methanoregula sp.]|jgi:HSP20 family molecular chaperone IbpA|uniref:Hsp20/alpha crystallin family protein n=1 Tax=Methanoregula sp. TaxID=2052170 RepID=UPI00260159F9|nr:Hsp20/alpha crystallin family protein [Methanoregula sp.]MCK9632251.1 Hsp20/alpha crystallin family protein [Methanoregula sp.]